MKLNEAETIIEQCIANYERIQDVLAGPDERYKEPDEMRNVRKWQRENAMLISHLDPLLDRFVDRSFGRGDIFVNCAELTDKSGAWKLGTALIRLQQLWATLKRLAQENPGVDVMALKTEQSADDCGILVVDLIKIAKGLPPTTYRDNLVVSLQELQTCYAAGCYIATLFLAGKVLEFCLKIILTTHAVQYDKQWGLGKLIGCVRDNCTGVQLVDGLGSIGNLILDNRNPAVHANERNPVPSREQAIMVLNALADVMKRTFPLKQ